MNLTDAAIFALDAYNRSDAPGGLEVPFGADIVLELNPTS